MTAAADDSDDGSVMEFDDDHRRPVAERRKRQLASSDSEATQPAERGLTKKKKAVTDAEGFQVPRKAAPRLKVNDMLNSFAFYSGKIHSSDYEKIKAEHGLLIDFEDFIGYLITLLKKCNKNSEDEEMAYTLQLDYNASGETTEYSLQVVETNHLRKFCHLSISLAACGDKEIKETLCKSFKQLQGVNDSLGEEVRKKTDELQTLKRELQEKIVTLETVNKALEEDVKKMKLEYDDAISREKARMDKIFSECNEKHKAEIVHMEGQHTRVKQDLEYRLKAAETRLCESNEKCRVLKLDNEELSGVVEKLQEIERSTGREITKLQSQLEAKDSLMRERQATRRVLVMKYKALLRDFSLTAEKVKSLQGQLDSAVKREAKLRNQAYAPHLRNHFILLKDEQEILGTSNDFKKKFILTNVTGCFFNKTVQSSERRLQEECERASAAEVRCQQLEAQLAEKSADCDRLQLELASKESALRSSEAAASVLSRQLRQLQLHQRYPHVATSRTPLGLASARPLSSGSCGDPLRADTFRRQPQPATVSDPTSSYFSKRL
ncbi:polyamine-modulated factor 1-binding protein 1-like [Schistocerca gregaria]|uniref:polyamine-modulated factor 1-binding protein 1-like n=1 Tax=Schistocerca gregaria TaxID=7010 RepID=UPI00211E5ADE|nr:polyamine-modulated factor 1-binding protein 1-like [Schistocerca gregaria]